MFTWVPRHMAAAVSPTKHGVFGITLITCASFPAASCMVARETPAAMDTNSLFEFTSLRTSCSTVATYYGFVHTNTMSLLATT